MEDTLVAIRPSRLLAMHIEYGCPFDSLFFWRGKSTWRANSQGTRPPIAIVPSFPNQFRRDAARGGKGDGAWCAMKNAFGLDDATDDGDDGCEYFHTFSRLHLLTSVGRFSTIQS